MSCREGGGEERGGEERARQTDRDREPIEMKSPNSMIGMWSLQEEEPVTYPVGINQLQELIREYSDNFSECPSIVNVYEHHINITELEKFIRSVYSIPVKHQEDVCEEI